MRFSPLCAIACARATYGLRGADGTKRSIPQLIPRPSFDLLKSEEPLPVAYLLGLRRGPPRQRDLSLVAGLAKAVALPDATINDGELKISPVRAAAPKEA